MHAHKFTAHTHTHLAQRPRCLRGYVQASWQGVVSMLSSLGQTDDTVYGPGLHCQESTELEGSLNEGHCG